MLKLHSLKNYRNKTFPLVENCRIMFLRWFLLVLLVLQNSSLILVMRLTRSRGADAALHAPSTCVFLSEIVKMVTVLAVLSYQHGTEVIGVLKRDVFSNRQTLLLAIPAILYTFQTNILWVGISILPAPTYMITSQMKIVITALFSVYMLGQTLSFGQKIALFLLQVGVIIVQLGQMPSSSNNETASEISLWRYLIGIGSVLAACCSSGFASVFFERMLKANTVARAGATAVAPPSLWVRNVQLGLFAIFISAAGMYSDRGSIMEHGLLYGYDKNVWFVVLNSSAGGILVAAVMKYADNIVKGFMTSISIVLASAASIIWLNFVATPMFVVGAILVCTSVYLYSQPDFLNSPKTTK